MKFYYLYIIVLLSIFFNACISKEKIPPPLPSVESISFNFSYFEEDSKEDTHFSFVSEKVLEWKTLLKDSLKIHHAILNNATQNELIFQKDKTWLNDFSFSIGNKGIYSAKFFSIIEADTVRYKTFISYDYFSEIIYLDGHAYDNTKIGEWELNKTQRIDTTKIKFLTANWNFLKNDQIKFTNNQAGEDNLNSILQMDSVDNDYNTYIDIYNKGDENHSIIQWNSSTKIGRVKDQLRFSNEDWHYWDDSYEDTN